MGMGAPAVAAAGALLAQNSALARGAAYPLLVVGTIELVGGLVFFARTNRQVAALERDLRLQPAHFRQAELARMDRVNRQFRLLEVAEVALLLAGATMGDVGAVNDQQALAGVGLGVAFQSTALLIFDHFAARRALRYTESLARFAP